MFASAAPAESSASPMPVPRIFTIGHSNHELETFFRLLSTYRITDLVDVRSIPSSGRFPHFKKRSLEDQCSRRGISYRHCPALGNKVGGIASLLKQPEGQAAIAELVEKAQQASAVPGMPAVAGATAYMCAEAAWRDCHRQVVAQKLLEDYGIMTSHILPVGGVEPHPHGYILPSCYGVASPEESVACCVDEGDDSAPPHQDGTSWVCLETTSSEPPRIMPKRRWGKKA